jgi:hypothetical protein
MPKRGPCSAPSNELSTRYSKRIRTSRGERISITTKFEKPLKPPACPTPTVYSNAFIYQPLDPAHQSIRLLAITAKPNGDLSYHLIQDARLSSPNCLEYIALSYTWGPPNPTQHIQVDGKFITIRQNLYDFLEHFRPGNALRGVASIELTTYFWIDQICINQHSSTEKNHQVAMMADIYRSSSSVEVWLGLGTESSDLAMRYFCALDKLERGIARGTKKNSEFLYVIAQHDAIYEDLTSMDYLLGLGNEEVLQLMFRINLLLQNGRASLVKSTFYYRPKPELIFSFHRRLANPYWKRLWILQEVMLARCVIFTCGKFSVPGDWFQQICEIGGDTIKGIWDGQGSSQNSFKIVVEKFCDNECQDPRDKIYGLRAILSSELQNQILVDYTKSVEQVYIEGILLILRDYMYFDSVADFSQLNACRTLGRNMKPQAETQVLERLRAMEYPGKVWNGNDRKEFKSWYLELVKANIDNRTEEAL